MLLDGVHVKWPELVMFVAIVAAVPKAFGFPCFKSNVIVPEVVGVQVISTGLPAVKPVARAGADSVNGFCADTSTESVARPIAIDLYILDVADERVW